MGPTAERRLNAESVLRRRRRVGGLWLWWALANLASWALIGVTLGAVDLSVSMLFGLVIGGAQGLVLWRHLKAPTLALFWTLVSTIFGPIGLVVGLGIALALGLAQELPRALTIGAATALAVGYSQGPALRARTRLARWWPVAVLAGAVAAVVAGFGLALLAVAEPTLIALAGAVYGAVTGGELTWLLSRTRHDLPSPNGRS